MELQTAALGFGGQDSAGSPPNSALAETWNGTIWTAVGNLNTGRARVGGLGSTTAGLAFGGTPYTAATEEFNNPGTITKTLTS